MILQEIFRTGLITFSGFFAFFPCLEMVRKEKCFDDSLPSRVKEKIMKERSLARIKVEKVGLKLERKRHQ